MIPRPGPHGGDGDAVARALGLDPARVVDLSMSLNPWAPDIEAIARPRLGTLRRYPDPTAATAAFAEVLGEDPGRVLLTNGGSEAIALVASVLGGTVAAEPEFSLHPRGAGPPLWRSNPHNPTGVLAPASAAADVWDEAFYPLATGRWTRGDDAVVVGSFTKLYAAPGLRLGYVVADDAARFARSQPAWSVSTLGLAVLPDLLAVTALERWAAQIAARRDELADLLRRHGFEPAPSDAPWLLVEAPGLREALAPHGVVVRDCTSFGLPRHARIAVPGDHGLERLEAVLPCVARQPGTA